MTCVETSPSRLLLARLLDALLASVQGALLALGRLHHFLLGLGIYGSCGQREYQKQGYQSGRTGSQLLLVCEFILIQLLLVLLRGLQRLDLAT